MLEKKIDRYLREKVEREGGMCLKWVSPGCTGVPNRIVFLPDGRIYFVELKRPKGTRRARQIRMAAELFKRGQWVHVLDSVESIDLWVELTIREKRLVSLEKIIESEKVYERNHPEIEMEEDEE